MLFGFGAQAQDSSTKLGIQSCGISPECCAVGFDIQLVVSGQWNVEAMTKRLLSPTRCCTVEANDEESTQDAHDLNGTWRCSST